MSAATDRELRLVELVDDTGTAIGETTVQEAHSAPGQRHRAFSVVLLDDGERMLTQRRAATKTRFPRLWANTCCGHADPGRSVTETAEQRLAEELGIVGVPLGETNTFVYRATDPRTGQVEHEYDHVLIGRVDTPFDPPQPDPAELSEWAWTPPPRLLDETAVVPWLAPLLAAAALNRSAAGKEGVEQ